MVLSKTAVCNFAYAQLGHATALTDITTGTDPASVIFNRIYDTVLEELLRDYNWPFALKMAELDHVETDPTEDWDNSYRYPRDCVMLRRIVPGLGTGPAGGYRLESRQTVLKYRRVKDDPLTITAITQASPGVITVSAAHGLAANDHVVLEDIGGMTELDDVEYLVNTAPLATTLSVKTMAGVAVDTTAFTVYTSGGTVQPDDLIYSDEGDSDDPANAEYTALVENPTFYPPDFTWALAFRLAAYAAPTLSRDPKLSELVYSLWRMSDAKAKAAALNEGMPDEEPDAEWIAGR